MLLISHPDIQVADACKNKIEWLAAQLNKTFDTRVMTAEELQITPMDDESMIFLAVPMNRRELQRYLNATRELRIPYTFLTEPQREPRFEHILVPINFLEEEAEKAQFAAAFGRFCNARITLMPANDYGSRAARNTQKIAAFLDKFTLSYEIEKGEKDSFKIEIDAAMQADHRRADLIIISASRDYGLDDLLLGPKERKVVLKSPVPVMLVNPRGDLYALCD